MTRFLKQCTPLFFLLVGALALAPFSATATVYRCNGRVQFRPCKPTEQVTAISSFPRRREVPRFGLREFEPIEGGRYAEVIAPELSRIGERGIWRGRVKGNGNVHLELVIMREGIAEERLQMGSVN